MNEKNGTDGDSVWTGFRIMGKALLKQGRGAFQSASAQIKETIDLARDPNERFKRAVATKYKTLRAAGMNEKEAHEWAVKQVREELDRISKKGDS